MAFPVSGGRPDFAGGGVTDNRTFIPEIWSGKLIVNFYDATVLTAISNTDYEGEIKSHGDTVHIRTVPEVTIRPYSKGTDLLVETPDGTKLKLVIDQGEYFNCLQDNVDRIQSDIALMDKWSEDASEKFKIVIDRKVLKNIPGQVAAMNSGASAGRISGNINLGSSGTAVALTPANVVDVIVNMGTVLDEANIPETGRWLVLPPAVCGLIKRSELKDASLTGDSTTMVRNGRMGMIDRFTIYKSNLLDKVGGTYNIIGGTTHGLTFASQYTEMDRVKSERTFGELIRGLQVYGYKVVKPEALVLLRASVAAYAGSTVLI